ncbi:MAG: CopA family copper-resistance protein [Lysobacterales bacterium]|jgi:CopA family copper-resistance protein
MNNRKPHASVGEIDYSRRQFVQGLAMGGAIASLGIRSAFGGYPQSMAGNPVMLTGNDFRLNVGTLPVNFTGKERLATAINGSIPCPVLRWKEGQEVTLAITNHLAHDTSIHWHGIILPSEMDGVPNISDNFPGIPPGETFVYRFRLNQSGTYWFHSHSGFQEQTGMYGAIIIDPAEPDPVSFDREYVVVLSDWTDEKPESVFAKLKKRSDYYNFSERTTKELHEEIKNKGVSRTWADRKMWNVMRMSDRDISDVSGHTYTFLMNGQTPAEGWKCLFKKGEKVRLRIVNAAAMTFFDVRIPGLDMKVVASDGQNIEPVSVEEFRIGVAETYDVVVEPRDDTAYTIFAQAIDRTGYARGTLTPDLSLTAVVPELDGQPILSHGDMGMDMASMGHDMSAMGGDMEGMDHGNMKGMDHSNMSMKGISKKGSMGDGPAGYGSKLVQRHAQTEFGPHMDMRADDARYQLDDPGVGLRDNGRRVLTYSQIHNLYPTPDPREPSREINLHLTGNMSRYMWSMNGIKFADAEPLILKYGERVRINLLNDTMMNHPIHLHGMWSDMETGEPGRIPRKHTVIVPPGAKISYLVTADAMGGWAYHCHLIYHMSGMFRKVEVVS